MEASQSPAGRGLWNCPRTTEASKQAQDMLRVVKQESRLTILQRKQLNKCPKNGPLTSDPAQSSPPSKSSQKRLPARRQRRSAASCRSGDSYVREKYHPAPTRDLEEEKRRLQSILATGEEEPPAAAPQKAPAGRDPGASEAAAERYQEVLNEIEERRQFLADMASLGQERQYVDIINTEISQKIRELEVLDRASSPKED